MENNIENKLSLLAQMLSSGLKIPHYCYHLELPLIGSCRACLLKFNKAKKSVAACVTDISLLNAGNFYYGNSPLVKKARENILEFLLLNHPLDCPVCDQGGICDLQDQSAFFGLAKRRFYKFKRAVPDKNLGLTIKTYMARCIHCTRCVRFYSEVIGVEEIAMLGRGMLSEIGTYVRTIVNSELSGNAADICPVTHRGFFFLY